MGIRDRPTAPRSPWQNGHTERLIGSMPIGAHELGSHAVLLITKYMLDAGAHLRRLTPSRDAMASMLSSRPARNMLRVAIARAIREARPSSIAFAAPLPITRRTPFPARRRLAGERFDRICWLGRRVGHYARHDCGSIEPHQDLGWGVAVMAGPILGPVLGGWLTANYTWRYVFYINLPIGILAFLGMRVFLTDTARNASEKLDWLGFATLSLATRW